MFYDRIAPADRKTLQLARIGEENTTIVEWDIDKAVQARYRAGAHVKSGNTLSPGHTLPTYTDPSAAWTK